MSATLEHGDMRLPLAVEDVNAIWLTAALSVNYPGVEVTSAEIVEVNQMTSTKIRVRLAYNAAGARAGLPPTLIVKGGLAPHSPAMKDMYRKEMRFYRDVRPRVRINTPRCFYAGADPASHQSIVILEDLAARNVLFCHVQRPHGYQAVARCLDDLAGFHAQTWDSPDLKPGGPFQWIEGRFEGFGSEYMDRYFQADVWRSNVEAPRGAAVSTRLHDFNWVIPAMKRLAEYHRQAGPWCLVHGDCHVGNTYVDGDGSPGFIDPQITRGPWQMDVTKYLVGALDVLDRREWEASLLTRYLERLRVSGIVPPSFDAAWEAHRREVAYGFIMFMINETRFQTEAANTAYVARYAAAVLDHGTRELLS